MKICKNCNLENSDESKFCVGCGGKLEGEIIKSFSCQKCGFENDKEAKFCTNCGTQLEVLSMVQNEENNKKTKNETKEYFAQRGIKFILFLAIACVVLAGGFFVYDRYIKVGTHNTELRGFPGRTVDALMNSYTHGRVEKYGDTYRIYFDKLNPTSNGDLKKLGVRDWFVELELVYNKGFKQYVVHGLSDNIKMDPDSKAVSRGCMAVLFNKHNISDYEEEEKLLLSIIGEDKDYPKEMVDNWIATIHKKIFPCIVGVGDEVGVPGWHFDGIIIEDEGDTVVVKANADGEVARIDRKSIKLPN